MTKLQVLNTSGQVAGEIEIPAKVFSYPVKQHLLHEAVIMRLANERRGTAEAKTRAEVSGSNRKPWRQKGTGRARAGSIRSPLWRKGGSSHGPRPRDYHYEIPRQAKRNALKSALALRFAENRLLVLAEAELKNPKTKEAVSMLKTLHLDSALIVDRADNRNLFTALRNIPRVKAVDSRLLSAFDVLGHEWLVFTQRALQSLLKRLTP
ncbi:MAG: 50S ribosomal protein L4 [Candidatus Aminicenantales bacterium]